MKQAIQMQTLTPPKIDDATRREFLIGAAGLLLLPFGCGSGEDRGGVSGETRVVKDADGNEVEVPKEPERVVAADNLSLPFLLELGIVPVAAGSPDIGSGEGRAFPKELYPLGAGEVKAYGRDAPDYELLARLEPHLIVASKFVLEGRVDSNRYSEIAPTVSFDAEDPVEQLRLVAKIVGREERAEEIIARFERRLENLPEPNVETVSLIDSLTGDGNYFLYTEGTPPTDIFAQAFGVDLVPQLEGQGVERYSRDYAQISAELLGEVDGEAIVVLGRGERGVNALEGNPLWPTLPAVRAGRVFYTDFLLFYGNGGLGALGDLYEEMGAFLAGEPQEGEETG